MSGREYWLLHEVFIGQFGENNSRMDLEDQNLGKKRRSGYKPNEIQHGCCGQRHFPVGKASRPIVPRDTPCNIHGR